MIELIIEGKHAVLNNDTSFKISLENQFFTKTSSFSFDIELSLDEKDNRDIFGHIYRMDCPKEDIKLQAKLIVDNIPILSGYITLSQVNEKGIKIQLVGESAEYKFRNIAENNYVDELPLGDWWNRSQSYPQPDENSEDVKGSSHIMMRSWPILIENDYQSWVSKVFRNNKWFAFPIYNSSADTLCNGYVLRMINGTPRFELPYATPNSGERNGDPQMKLAIQPYLWYMCQLIAEASGFNLDLDDNYIYKNDLFRRIIIANANINIECNKCLPHWTVNEWWSQIEKTFGVAMVISDDESKMKLIPRNNYVSNFLESIYINDIVDEYSTTLEDDPEFEDIFSQNVGYSDSAEFNLESRVSNEIIEIAPVKKFDSFEDMIYFSLTDLKANKYILEWENRHFVYSLLRFKEINQFRSRYIRDSKDIDVELKFVPCEEEPIEVKIVSDEKDADGVYLDNIISTMHVTGLKRPDKTNISWKVDERDLSSKIDFDLWNIIIDESEEAPAEEETQDLAYLAIVPADFYGIVAQGQNTYFPRAWTKGKYFYSSFTGSVSQESIGYSLSLNKIDGIKSIASETLSSTDFKINTRIKHCIKFISKQIPKRDAIFIINNKKYLCEKIEVSISYKGVDNLMTGYFFQIN